MGEERETIKLKQEKRKRTQIRTKADKTLRTLNECFYAKEVKTIFLPLQLYFKLQNNMDNKEMKFCQSCGMPLTDEHQCQWQQER